MHRIDGEDVSGSLPTPGAPGTAGYFRAGDPGGGIAPTQVTADWANAVQQELVNAIQGGGKTLDKTVAYQLWQVMRGVYATIADAVDTSGAGDDTHFNRFAAAVLDGRASGECSAAIAAEDTFVSGDRAAALAAENVWVSAALAVALAAGDIEVHASNSAAIAASGGQIHEDVANLALLAATLNVTAATITTFCKAAIACQDSRHESSLAVLVASAYVKLNKNLSIAGGWDPSGTPAAHKDNQTWRIESMDTTGGSAHGRGLFEGGTSAGPADYAEFFENVARGALEPTLLVARVGRRVQLAGPGDKILGIVSAKPAVVGNAAPFEWSGRWVRDASGRPLQAPCQWLRAPGYDGPAALAPQPPPGHARAHMRRRPAEGMEKGATLGQEAPDVAAKGGPLRQEIAWLTWPPYDGPLSAAPPGLEAHGEVTETRRQVQSPEWDPHRDYVPREQRPEEWTCVGLLGQLPVRVDASVRVDDYVGAAEGGMGTRSTKATRVECMEILWPYDEAQGYGLALCLVR